MDTMEKAFSLISEEEKQKLKELVQSEWFAVLKKIWEQIYPREVWLDLINVDLDNENMRKAIIKNQDYVQWVLQFLALVEQLSPDSWETIDKTVDDNFITPNYNPSL